MADSDSELRIKAVIDSTDADSGAAQVAGDLDQIKDSTGLATDATEEAATGFGKMMKEAGGMREATRLSREFFESIQGGYESIAGLSGIARYALIASEALGPAGPIVGALAALGLSFVSVWAMHEQKSGEAKDKVAGDLADSGDDVKTYKDVWKTALDEVLKAQEELEKSDARQLAAIKGKGDAEKAVIEVQKEAAIEQARTAYLAKLSPDMSNEDRQKAKDEFEAQKSDITNESEVATAKLAVKTKKSEVAAQQKALADAQTDLAALQLSLTQAQKAKVTAANALANLGITFATDKDGAMKFTDFDGNDVTAGSQKEIDDLLDLINNQRGVQSQAGGPGKRPEIDSYLAQLNTQLTSAEEFQNSLVLYARDIQNFGAARDSLGKSIETDKGKIEDATGKLDDAKQQLDVLTQKVPVAEQRAANDKWEQHLVKICEEYNASRQEGKMTGGLTPLQAWRQFQTDPLAKLPPVARYLLAHHKWPVKVGRNGITLRFGKQAFTYRNAETGELRGQQALAWFNPELPELLAVTDMNRENCFTVERAKDVDAMDATPEELSAAMASVNAHNSYARQRYRMIAPLANLNPRPTIMDADTARLGLDIERQKAEGLAKREKRVTRAREGSKAFSRLGYRPRADENITDKQLGAADELTKLLQED